MMVPMLDEVIQRASGDGVRTIFIGMAHRGRLNVLRHILRKPSAQILAEFKDPTTGYDDPVWTGDVKYHSGAAYTDPSTGTRLDMPPNPSHLEAVNPVVEGMARAAESDASAPGAPHFDATLTLPILIHGDAAFPGQGVVAETLKLSRLPGYWTGGTLHIIANNRSASRRGPTSPAARATPATWPAGSKSRSCTSTRTIRKPASRWRGWRWRTGPASSAIS